VYVGSLDSTDRTQLLDFISHAEYASGHLLFVREGALVAQPLDVTRLTLSGEPALIAGEVNVLVRNAPIGGFSVAEDGTLAFEDRAAAAVSQLASLDRTGRPLGTLGNAGDYDNRVQLSPDGSEAVVARSDKGAALDLFVLEVSTNVERRVTSARANDTVPVWSADGRGIAFSRRSQGIYALHLVDANGSGLEERLPVGGVNTFPQELVAWWRFPALFESQHRNDRADLWVLPLSGERKPLPFLETAAITWGHSSLLTAAGWPTPRPNRDAMRSRSRPFLRATARAAQAKWRVSEGAGHAARWRRDGREIYYWSPDSKMLMAVPVRADGSTLHVGRAEALFEIRPPLESYPWTFYDVSPDGQRFLINRIVPRSGAPQLSLIVNWPTLLKDPPFS
jgi:dipeptidyl aminopeptidase/acylaminoacyl peptidase